MISALEWTGSGLTLAGYFILVQWSRLHGAIVGGIGVVLLGVWATLTGAFGLASLEAAFVAINIYVVCREVRGRP